MSQQIINIPINWDDDAITRAVETGVIKEVKEEVEARALKRLGLSDRWGSTTNLFDDTIKECFKELIEENKDFILDEICKRATQSLIRSKAFKEIVNHIQEDGDE